MPRGFKETFASTKIGIQEYTPSDRIMLMRKRTNLRKMLRHINNAQTKRRTENKINSLEKLLIQQLMTKSIEKYKITPKLRFKSIVSIVQKHLKLLTKLGGFIRRVPENILERTYIKAFQLTTSSSSRILCAALVLTLQKRH